jgi:hypothetical protein
MRTCECTRHAQSSALLIVGRDQKLRMMRCLQSKTLGLCGNSCVGVVELPQPPAMSLVPPSPRLRTRDRIFSALHAPFCVYQSSTLAHAAHHREVGCVQCSAPGMTCIGTMCRHDIYWYHVYLHMRLLYCFAQTVAAMPPSPSLLRL